MKRILLPALLLLSAHAYSYTEIQIYQAKEQIVRMSTMGFPGECPCPNSMTRMGAMCGKKSAYSHQARLPKCFPEDVSNTEAINYLNAKE